METAELKQFCPLVDCQLDTMKDNLHQITGSTSALVTGSAGASVVENASGYTTESLEIQDAGSTEIQTAEESEVAIITSSAVECTSAHVMIYPNSGSVNPFIIIENKSRQLPVMNSDTAEAPGSLERGDRGATVTTDIAGAEHKTRTGCQYTQVSRTHVERVSEEIEETSRECSSSWIATAYEARYPHLDEEDPDDQDSFTKLLAELNLEIEEEVDIELEGETGSIADAGTIQGNTTRLDYCVTSAVLSESLAEVLLKEECDVWADHPTSALGDTGVADSRKTQLCSEQVPTSRFKSAKQEVPRGIAELEPEGLALGIPLPASDRVGSAKVEGEEEVLYANTTTPVNEGAFTVDNEEVQRLVDLQEVFSFHTSDGITVQDTPDSTTVQDIMYQMMTDETFPIYDDDVANARSHSGNEFTLTPEREITTLQTGREGRSVSSLVGETAPLRQKTGKRMLKTRRISILLDSLVSMKVEMRICRWKVDSRHHDSRRLCRQSV